MLGRSWYGLLLFEYMVPRAMVEAKRASMPVSLPTDIVEELDAFMERYGKRLGYRGRSDFIAAAIRSQREHDEARALRLRALDETPDDAPLWTA